MEENRPLKGMIDSDPSSKEGGPCHFSGNPWTERSMLVGRGQDAFASKPASIISPLLSYDMI